MQHLKLVLLGVNSSLYTRRGNIQKLSNTPRDSWRPGNWVPCIPRYAAGGWRSVWNKVLAKEHYGGLRYQAGSFWRYKLVLSDEAKRGVYEFRQKLPSLVQPGVSVLKRVLVEL